MSQSYLLLVALAFILAHIVKRNECKDSATSEEPNRHHTSDIEGHWYVASIRLRTLDIPFGNGHICSGTLFAVNKILSSADCLIQDMDVYRFFNPSNLRIVLGTEDRLRKQEDTVVISNGIKYAYHPNYDTKTGANDVSVIFFQQGILKNHPFIKPLPLIKNFPNVGEFCNVASWFYDSKAMQTSYLLQDNPMFILPRKTCSQSNLEGLICTESNLTKIQRGCSSELGEGLICNLKLAGIVSYDISCQWPNSEGSD